MSNASGEAAELDREHRFRVHAAYIRAFTHMAVGASLDVGLRRIADRADQLRTGTRATNSNNAEIVSSLSRAWGTELLLATTIELSADSDVIRLANAWVSVQAYYALHAATQALLIAEGHRHPPNHEAVQKGFTNLWVGRRFDLTPWTFAVTSVGAKSADADGFIGGPGRPIDMDIHPWSNWRGDQCWDIAGRALRSTRVDQISKRIELARRNKRDARRREFKEEQSQRASAGHRGRKQPSWWDAKPHLTAAEKRNVDAGLRPTSIADYLYRLRIRANYEDAAMFVEGPRSDAVARKWANDLRSLTSASLFGSEIRLMHLLGRTAVLRAADDWLSRNRSSVTEGVVRRRDILDEVFRR